MLLLDDTIQVTETHPDGGGRYKAPTFLKRTRLPKAGDLPFIKKSCWGILLTDIAHLREKSITRKYFLKTLSGKVKKQTINTNLAS